MLSEALHHLVRGEAKHLVLEILRLTPQNDIFRRPLKVGAGLKNKGVKR